MADDLEEIRAKRMAELQKQYGGGGPGKDEQEEKSRQMAEMKHSILSQVLDQSARARLNAVTLRHKQFTAILLPECTPVKVNTIALAKPEKAEMVENMLMQMAQMGQIQGKLGEDQLIRLLSEVSERTQKKTTVKFDRRRMKMDDSDEDD